MSKCLVFEDGELINDINYDKLWSGYFSEVNKNGPIINFIKNNLPKNTIFVVPKSDGNIKKQHSIDYKDIEWNEIQPFIDYAKNKNKTFILGVLSHVDKEEEDINYLYIPLDDNFFENGVEHYFPNDNLLSWKDRSSDLCWRGGCSGVLGGDSLRVNFVKKLFGYPNAENIRLSNWWSENKNIPSEYFADRINYTEFLKYKIFFIVDGNVIASNHMWGFASGCVPFLISNGKCWFSWFIKPYVHYIPINYDLSNLIEQIEYIKNNDEIAEKIASNALQFSKEYFSSDYQKKYLLENINKFTRTTISVPRFQSKKRKVIECFTFYNELELLYYKLNLLYESVDYFILVESNYTYAGNRKELFYKNNSYLFKKFSDKIVHIVIDLPFIHPTIDYNKNEQWANEFFQRNSIDKGIKLLNLNDDDLIIISDLDEIISPNNISIFKNVNNVKEGFILVTDMYYYNLNCRHKEGWERVKLVTYKKYKESTPQAIRMELILPKIHKCGWHLSYFGDAKFINNKLLEFGHQEYNSEHYTNISNIENKLSSGVDLFNRSYVLIDNVKIEDNFFLPPKYNLYLNNYFKKSQPKKYKKKIVIYFHICCINNWLEIVTNLLFKIKLSGLYSNIFEIRCVVLGNYENIEENKSFFQDNKIKIIYNSNEISSYEKKTINMLYEDSMVEDFYVLYIHSKGVKHYNTHLEENVYDWVEYLSYFNIYMYEKNIELLDKYDAVGVNLQVHPGECPLHYSGNFWWSKSSHIKKLHIINDDYYNSPEFWITSTKGNYVTLWNSDTHHYNSPYKFINYENKDIYMKIFTQE